MLKVFGELKNKKWFVFCEIVLIICMIIALGFIGFSPVLWNNPSELYNWTQECIDEGWYYLDGEGNAQGVTLPCVIRFEGDESSARPDALTLYGIVPQDVKNGQYVSTKVHKSEARVYVDGELRDDCYYEWNSLPYREGHVSRYAFAPLYEEDAGKTILIEFVGDNADKYTLSEVHYGEKIGLVAYYLKQNQGFLALAIVMIVMSLICICTGIAIRIIAHNKFHIDYMGWALFWVGLWNLTQSGYRDFLFADLKAISFVPVFCLMLCPIALALYFNSLQQGRYGRIYVAYIMAALLHIMLRLVLQFMHVSDFYSALTATFVILFSLLAIVAVTYVWDYKRGYAKNYWVVVVGMASLGVSGIVQLVNFTLNPYFSNPIPLSVGMLLLDCFAVIHALQMLIGVVTDKNSALQVADLKSQFLANMSHEIRTPINAVLGMNEMILRESTEDNVKSYATDVDSAGKVLLSLINDILDFSKLDSGNMTINPNEYDVKSMILTCVNLNEKRAKEKNLEFNLEVDENVPARLYGDEVRVSQIITNILTNAVKYTKEGSVTLKVWGKFAKGSGYLLRVDVTDTGIGIKEEDREKLFSSFARLDEKKNKNIEGTGLGLAITAKLVKLMEGTINVKSVYTKGSTFSVEVPQGIVGSANIGKIDVNTLQNHAVKRASRDLFTAARARILVVDDVPLNLKVATSLLKKTKITVDTAVSGDECIAKVCEVGYDVIMLDHMMPGKDGIETLHEMKALKNSLNEKTPVIMLTANAIAGAREQFINEGFDDYLSKPFSINELQNMLLKYLPKDKIDS